MAFWHRLLTFGSSSADNRQNGLQTGETAFIGDNAATQVTMDSALQLSAVWACTRIIAESIASLPINVYKVDRKTGIRELDTEHAISKLFSGKVNRWQTRQEFFETIVYQLVFRGNDYSLIKRDSRNNITSLIPLMASQMQVTLLASGKLRYRYTDGSKVTEYTDSDIWHNKLFGNGTIGLSVLSYARYSLGIAQAAEKSVTDIYKNGGKPSGVLKVDKFLTTDQITSIKTNFASINSGNTDRLKVLEGGMDYKQVSLSPQDIELLASRKFQIEDIARFFGVPSVLINDTSAGTTWGSGIQQIVQGFYKMNLRPYLERYEASIKNRLLSPIERLDYDIEFDFDALLKPDQAERIKTYKEGVQSGIMTPNQARAKEGWQGLAGGDDLYMQKQMLPISKLGLEGKINADN